MRSGFDELPLDGAFYVTVPNRKDRPMERHRVMLGRAAAIICVHNHPSGDPAPSSADLQITRLLREGAKTLEIALLDHVIIGNPMDDPQGTGYYSFREAGLL